MDKTDDKESTNPKIGKTYADSCEKENSKFKQVVFQEKTYALLKTIKCRWVWIGRIMITEKYMRRGIEE